MLHQLNLDKRSNFVVTQTTVDRLHRRFYTEAEPTYFLNISQLDNFISGTVLKLPSRC